MAFWKTLKSWGYNDLLGTNPLIGHYTRHGGLSDKGNRSSHWMLFENATGLAAMAFEMSRGMMNSTMSDDETPQPFVVAVATMVLAMWGGRATARTLERIVSTVTQCCSSNDGGHSQLFDDDENGLPLGPPPDRDDAHVTPVP